MSRANQPSRREMLKWSAAAASGAVLGGGLPVGWATDQPKRPNALPQRPWGKVGRPVDMLWMGTSHLPHVPHDDAVQLVRYALDQGIRFIDTAYTYDSEHLVGEAIKGRRDDLFIMTKTTDRTYDGAMRELEASLQRLGTDHVDLWNVHSIGFRGVSGDEEVAALRKPDGVMKAMRKMKSEGVAKHIGFTGHVDPQYMLQVIAWDAEGEFEVMLFTISAALAKQNQRGWEDNVLPAGKKKNYGLIGMKVLGAGRAVGQGQDRAPAASLMKYVYDLGLPTVTIGMRKREEVDEAIRVCRAYAAAEQKPDAGAAHQAERERIALRRRFTNLFLPFEHPDYIDGASRYA